MSFLISLVLNREQNRRGADIGSYVLISFAKFAFCDLPFIDDLFKNPMMQGRCTKKIFLLIKQVNSKTPLKFCEYFDRAPLIEFWIKEV